MQCWKTNSLYDNIGFTSASAGDGHRLGRKIKPFIYVLLGSRWNKQDNQICIIYPLVVGLSNTVVINIITLTHAA